MFGLQDSCLFLSSKKAFRTPDEPEVRFFQCHTLLPKPTRLHPKKKKKGLEGMVVESKSYQGCVMMLGGSAHTPGPRGGAAAGEIDRETP